MIQKLTSVIEALQEEVMIQGAQIQELSEENMKLRGSTNPFNIDIILNNPVLRQDIFDKLAK